MAQVELNTVHLTGMGLITCRKCRESTMVEPAAILLWDIGTWARVVTTEKHLLHRCGRLLQWWCRRCDTVSSPSPSVMFRRRKSGDQVVCLTCRTPIEQRLAPLP